MSGDSGYAPPLTDFDRAVILVTRVFAGRKDKSGLPLVTHSMAVASDLELWDDEHRVVAMLHDLVEDSDFTLDMVRGQFGDVIADAVDALTHRNNEQLELYWMKCSQNRIARNVKIADIRHNSLRIGYGWRVNKETKERWRDKYTRARDFFGMQPMDTEPPATMHEVRKAMVVVNEFVDYHWDRQPRSGGGHS